MKLVSIASFDVVHRDLPWPWIAFDPTGARFAFASSERTFATRVWTGDALIEGPSFALAACLSYPGVHAFAVDPRGELFAVTGAVAGGSVVVTSDRDGMRAQSRLEIFELPGFTVQAVAF